VGNVCRLVDIAELAALDRLPVLTWFWTPPVDLVLARSSQYFHARRSVREVAPELRQRGGSRSCRCRSRRGRPPRSRVSPVIPGVQPVCCSSCRTPPSKGMWVKTSCPQTGHQRNSNSASLCRLSTSRLIVGLTRSNRATPRARRKNNATDVRSVTARRRRRCVLVLRTHNPGSRTSAGPSPRLLTSHRRGCRRSGTQGQLSSGAGRFRSSSRNDFPSFVSYPRAHTG